MSSQEPNRSLDEDWTGVTDIVARRKLQNKLNQRALRARKREHQKSLSGLQQEFRNDTIKADFRRRYALILPRPDQQRLQLPQPRGLSEAAEMMKRFDAVAYRRYYAADPCMDHLLTLTKFNVFRALLGNLAALGLSIQAVEDDGDAALSPFNSNTDTPMDCRRYDNQKRNILPASLLPTTTQRSVPHHPWLDCFPYPQMRDNLINSPEGFDDCELCVDIMDPANGDIGIMVWGDPWLPQSWEVSELFLQKWSWVIEGCPEILVHSNYWRARRNLKSFRISN